MNLTNKIKIFVIAIFLLSESTYGQNVDSLKLEVQRLTSGIDFTRASTGIIWDVGRPFANLPAYNGIASVANISKYADFENICNTLKDAQVSGESIISFDDVYEAMEGATDKESQIALGVVAGQYNRFASDAITSGKIAWQLDHFVDVEGSATPFEKCNVLAGAFSRENLSAGKIYKLSMPAASYVTVGGALVENIQIDLLDGKGFQNILPNISLSFFLEDTGKFYPILKATLDGNKITTKLLLICLSNGPTSPPSIMSWSRQPQKIVSIPPRLGVHAGCTLEIGLRKEICQV